jgi:hypothetical protein
MALLSTVWKITRFLNMILILGKNISQYMQGSALHKHRTFYIAISPCMNTLDHGEILRAVSLFCKYLVSLKSCVEQLQCPHEKGSSSHSECLVQLFCLIYILLMHFVAYKKLCYICRTMKQLVKKVYMIMLLTH